MQEDIVNRMRRWAWTRRRSPSRMMRPEDSLWLDLADEIERLRGRVAELGGRPATRT